MRGLPLRSFLKYAAHYDLSALGVIEQALAVPMKRFDWPMLGFLTRPEMQAILDPNADGPLGAGSGGCIPPLRCNLS